MAQSDKADVPLLTEEDHESVTARQVPDRWSWSRLWPLVAAFLALSVGLNAFTLCRPAFQRDHRHSQLGGVNAAGLAWDVQTTFNVKTSPYRTTDRQKQDELWASDLVQPHPLTVALDDSYAEGELGLLHSMRWPWDENKGVYILQSGHQLHCLQTLRRTMNGFYDGHSVSYIVEEEGHAYEHTMHCLDMLLQAVMCYADDSLLFTGWLHDNRKDPFEETVPGTGSERVCRDWSKLRSWADDHSACFWPGYKGDNASTTALEQYKFCPDDRKPWEKS